MVVSTTKEFGVSATKSNSCVQYIEDWSKGNMWCTLMNDDLVKPIVTGNIYLYLL